MTRGGFGVPSLDAGRIIPVDDGFLWSREHERVPVAHEGARSRTVYLPASAGWRDAWGDTRYRGGTTLKADAPLERIPVYVRDRSDLELRG